MANYNTTRTGQWTRKISTPRIHDLVVRHLAYVEGLENIPRTGPVVFVANHSSYMDHFVMKTVVDAVHPGRVWFPTKAEAFETFLSRVWHESMDCYPVDRNAPGEEVFLRAREVLDRNDTLVCIPRVRGIQAKVYFPLRPVLSVLLWLIRPQSFQLVCRVSQMFYPKVRLFHVDVCCR